MPYCVDDALHLFRLQAMDELTPGAYGILEPTSDLRDRPNRRIRPGDVDLVMVPGVAFDRRGGRLGHGRGYYDRLLRNVRDDALLVGVAFECQVLERVPMAAHDVWLDALVTERGLVACARPTTGDGPSAAGR